MAKYFFLTLISSWIVSCGAAISSDVSSEPRTVSASHKSDPFQREYLYPDGHPMAGTPIDTKLSQPPVLATTAVAQSYFPQRSPEESIVIGNVSSGVETQFYVVQVPIRHGRAAVKQVDFLHEIFDQENGLFHGYFLMTAEDGRYFHYAPQNLAQTERRPYKSKYLVMGLEGLRAEGVGFTIEAAINGTLRSSWNLYTLESVLGMTAGTETMDRLKEGSLEITHENFYQTFLSPLHIQNSQLNSEQAKLVFASFMDRAYQRSLKEAYSLIGKTCNHTIENILLESGREPIKQPYLSRFLRMIAEKWNRYESAEKVMRDLGWFHPYFFPLRLSLLSYAYPHADPRGYRPYYQDERMVDALENAVEIHRVGWQYGR